MFMSIDYITQYIDIRTIIMILIPFFRIDLKIDVFSSFYLSVTPKNNQYYPLNKPGYANFECDTKCYIWHDLMVFMT